MSEKRFELTKINPTVNLSDTVYFIIDYENPNKEIRTLKDCVGLLNEQQELIEELQVSDEMGWKRAERFEKKCPKELHNKKMYIKRLEYKVQKFKEMNGEQQSTITELNKQIEQLNLAIDDLLTHTSCDEIKKENRQLKKQVKELKIENEAWQDSNDALAEDMFHRLEEVI